MQMITREADSTKQESSRSTDNTAHTFTTSSWSRLKDPRIVRVSRAFGGKDRHSKVCTVRGLRDRRVRLSAPTAIQLYDLQDRLGLNQPSKVVDWLLNAAKHEIDELPPLQFPQHTLLPPPINSHQIRPPADKQGLSEDVASPEDQRESWARSNQDISYHFSTQNFSSISPINSFVRWDPSNLTLSNTAGSDWHNLSQVYQQPSGLMSAQHQPYFHSQISASNAELFDSKNLNFQSSQLSNSSLTTSPTVDQSSSTLPVRPAHFNMTAILLPSQNNDGS